jgi:hypothetical protein
MTPGQILVADLVALTLLASLAGLAIRGRLAAAPAFAVYLAFVLATNRLIVWWPDTFWRRSFWQWKEATSTAIELLIALELAAIAFARWPRAVRLTRGALALAALVTIAGPILAFRGGVDVLAAAAWAQAGVTWAFVVLLAVATRYRLPLHGLHRAIGVGFVLYLAVYSTMLDLLVHLPGHDLLTALDPIAYSATVGFWAIAAWRREESLAGAGRVVYPWLRA